MSEEPLSMEDGRRSDNMPKDNNKKKITIKKKIKIKIGEGEGQGGA